jgi:hypothetical protein
VALDAELAEATTRATARHSAECTARLATLAREHERALGRLRSIGPERIGELARWVAKQVLERALVAGNA